MNPLIKHWQFTLLAFFLIISLGSIIFFGVNFGIDFKGGTLYQVELQRQVSAEEIARIGTIIQQRIDPGGLRGDIISPVGGKYLMIQTAETTPTELEKIESRIRQQGKFEAVLNGEVLFTGDEIKKIDRRTGFGVAKVGATYEWNLPFILNETAAKRFSEMTFHQCSVIPGTTTTTPQYECESTTFFLDKPNAIIVMSEEQYELDSVLLAQGDMLYNIPQGTDIDDLITDSRVTVITLSENEAIDTNFFSTALASTPAVLLSPDLNATLADDFNALGFEVLSQNERTGVPWIWDALRARQIIRLSPGITNENVADPSQAQIFSQLNISGTRETAAVAMQDLEELAILLESGSLSTPVKSISKETISPALGKTFFDNILLMGFLALIIIGIVIMVRYHKWTLALPLFLTVVSEAVLMVGLLSLPFIRQPFDLAAFAGLIAALGGGVNAAIIIVDELTSKTKKESLSLIQRIKNGLFIISTSALTIIGLMGPIIIFSRSMPGLSNLYGFAVVAILGALIGVLITRPAFTKIVELILEHEEKKERRH